MKHNEVLERLADTGIDGLHSHYPGASEHEKYKREGGIAGFNACRSKTIPELKDLLAAAKTATQDARERKAPDYQWFRYYELEVEWVCNCLSVLLRQQGHPIIVPPTARAASHIATIVGVSR